MGDHCHNILGNFVVKRNFGCINLGKNLKRHACDCVVGWTAIVALCVAFPLYLIGDNRLPLDCYSSLSDTNRSSLRLFFLLLALIVYVLLSVHLFIALFNKNLIRDDSSKTEAKMYSNNHSKSIMYQ